MKTPMQMKISTLTAFAVFSAFGASLAHSQVTNVDISSPGYRITSGSAGTRTFNQDVNVGLLGANPYSGAMNILLPDLGANIDITDADFTTYYKSTLGADTSLAVFAQISDTSTRTTDDYIAPAADGFSLPLSGWTTIQLDFVPAGSAPAENTALTLSESGQSNLASFLDTYYADTPAGGDYLVVGFALDREGTTGNNNRTLNFTSDGTTSGTVSQLSITAIPEPSSVAFLMAAGALGMVVLRRRPRGSARL